MKKNIKMNAEDRISSILDAVDSLLLIHSPRNITTKLIAKEAGVAEGLLYRYFESKWQMFFDTIERHVDSRICLLPKIDTINTFEKFQALVEKMGQMVYQNSKLNPQYFALISYMILERRKECLSIMNKRSETIIKYLYTCLELNYKKWGINKIDFKLTCTVFWMSMVHNLNLLNSMALIYDKIKTKQGILLDGEKVLKHSIDLWISSLKK
ncbi:MAG: TetR/AcrR family transcriptional regulator [Pseudomonadota bacterium]